MLLPRQSHKKAAWHVAFTLQGYFRANWSPIIQLPMSQETQNIFMTFFTDFLCISLVSLSKKITPFLTLLGTFWVVFVYFAACSSMSRKPSNIHMNTWIFVLSIFFEKLSNISYNKWSWAHRNKEMWYMTDIYLSTVYLSVYMSIYLSVYVSIYLPIISAKSLRNGSNKKYIFKILTRKK